MNKYICTALTASFALLGTGAAMAAPPAGFTYNDYTVANGTVSLVCPVGYTCQTLHNEPGFLQLHVSDGTAAGTYYRSIIVANDADAADPSAVDALAFRQDTFVGVADSSGAVASLSKVDLTSATGPGTGSLVAELATGALNDGNEPAGLRLQQNQNLGDRTVNLTFLDQGDGSVSLRMDQVNPVGGSFSGPMTVRRTTGSYTVCDEPGGTGCILELPDGQTLTYDSGNNIAVMYQHQALFSMGNVGAENRVFENQRYTVGANSIIWTNATNHMANGGSAPIDLSNGAFIGGVTFSTVNADGGAWDYWDDNFGTAPTGVTPPSTFPGTPFQP